MSILLDAVTKEKQQQMGELPDAVLTPRAGYKPATKQHWFSQLWGKALVLISVILLGVLSAWGLATLVQPTLTANSALTSSEEDAAVKQARTQQSQSTNTAQAGSGESAQAASGEIRIANKVALPLAKPQAVSGYDLSSNNSSLNSSFSSDSPSSNSSAKSSSNSLDNTQYEYRLNESNRGQVSSASQNELTASAVSATGTSTASKNDPQRQLTAAELTALYGEDAIILGANSNYKQISDLTALQMKVATAAENVNLEQQGASNEVTATQNTPEKNQLTAEQSNNLMAAFQAALKDVEYEESANKPVTEAEFDPIPTPKSDKIPKYGELPASVQLQVPEFNIQAHVYSSDANNRWLNIDGAELQEGDVISGKLKIIEIRPRDVILEIDGSEFKVPAI
ncbi:general secretion pathway protein GspB [Shewanella sp. UCD-KL21]|uniref:general secretion pathway protein GspB n=1 Tax=Shewanella sp. UCD-KL21 TaxID=1917164 RepID=UPI000970402D|nr:general secretion pathway protein GspB [Shewanella sp. UCD-KL21]